MLLLRHSLASSVLAAGLFHAVATSSHAGQRLFTYTYEATTAPKGSIEIENWVTWKHSPNGGRVDEFDFRHELEFGLTDHLQIGFYLANWNYTDGPGEDEARYENSGVELIWNLSNPTTDFLGSAVYLEVNAGNRSLEIEGKLLLQKNFGPVVVAYNAVLEAKWAGRHLSEETGGEIQQTLGASVELYKRFTAGAELLHEIDLPDWRRAEPSVLWMGPNASFRAGNFYTTVTGLFRVTSNEDEPSVQTRLIFGFTF